MFRIYDGRETFYQWDIDRKLIVEDETVDEVHFCNKTGDCALVKEVYELDGLRVVDVPNLLLQQDWKIRAYAYCGERYTKQCDTFKVVARNRPDDYVFEEEEVKTWEALEQRVERLETEGVPTELIEEIINEYMITHPIEVEHPVNSVNGKTGAVELTAEDVGALPADTVIPSTSGLATEKYVDDAVAAIDIPETDLSNYYTKEETNTAITDAIGEIKIPETDLSNYYTKGEVDKAIQGIDIPETDLSNYYTKEETDTAITDAIGAIEVGGSDYKRVYHCDDFQTTGDGAINECPQAFIDFVEAYKAHEGDAILKVWGRDTIANVAEESASIMLFASHSTGVECASWDMWVGDGVWLYQCSEYNNYSFVSGDSNYMTYDEVSSMIDERLGVIENGSY